MKLIKIAIFLFCMTTLNATEFMSDCQNDEICHDIYT